MVVGVKWVLGPELRSPARATSDLHCRATSAPNEILFLNSREKLRGYSLGLEIQLKVKASLAVQSFGFYPQYL